MGPPCSLVAWGGVVPFVLLFSVEGSAIFPLDLAMVPLDLAMVPLDLAMVPLDQRGATADGEKHENVEWPVEWHRQDQCRVGVLNE